jgi:hypothetical protein
MLSPEETQTLAALVAGPVMAPGAPGYAEDTAAFNLAAVSRPDVALGAMNAADVVAGVQWAAARNIPIAVQATGHGANSSIEGGLLINTSRMQDLQIDSVERTARIGAGVKWRSLLAASVPLGLVGLHGSSTDVGVVGYTLGGGLPILGRAYGFAADHVRSFEIVTPDGVLRHVDTEHEPELFSLLRGGKGNFGIVTSLTCNLLPVDEFYGGGIFFPGTDAANVLSTFNRWWPTLPTKAATSIALLRLPDLEFVPPPLRARFVVHLRFAYPGPQEEAETLLAPMRMVSSPIMDMAGPMSYLDVDMVHADPQEPLPYEEAGALLHSFDADAEAAFLAAAGPGSDCPLILIELRPLGGALSLGGVGTDAVSGRDAAFSLLAIGLTAPPIATATTAAIRSLIQAMAPYSTGRTLVNFHGTPGDATDRARAWSPQTYEELATAKSRWDPANLLRFGHTIRAEAAQGPERADRPAPAPPAGLS